MTAKSSFPREVFFRQIAKLQNIHDLKADSAFDRQAGLTNMLSRWKSGDIQEPTAANLLAVAEAFNVSLDWLLGRRPYPDLAEKPHAAFQLPGQALQPSFRAAIKKGIRDYLARTRERLTLDQEVRLEILLEDYCRDTLELPDDQVIKAYLVLCRKPLPLEDT